MAAVARRAPSGPAVDVALVVGLCVFDLVVSWNRLRPGPPPVVVVAYAVAGFVPLLLRRRYPLAVFGIVVLHAVVAMLANEAYFPATGIWLALWTVASRCTLRQSVAALAVLVVPATLNVVDAVRWADAANRTNMLLGQTLGAVLVYGSLFGVGRWSRWSAQRHEETRRSADEAIAVERSRIAQDLHDVVAHAVTLMLLQAGGAARLVRQDPDRAAAALEHVDALGQQALVELRRMLALLRPDDAAPGGGSPSSPSGLANLPSLVDRAGVDGRQARLVVEGDARAVEPGVDLTLYRIAQEALTNATRYADPAEPIDVHLRWRPEAVELEVRNRVPGRRMPARSAAGGYGLLGMRERVLSVDGRLDAGPQPDGTFVVRARVPAVAPSASPTGTAAPEAPATATAHG